MKTSLQAGASKFAHFAGLSRAADENHDDPEAKAKAEEEEKEKEEARKAKAKAKAEEDEQKEKDDADAKAKAEEEEKEKEEARKAKAKAKAEEDDEDKDDDKDEMTGRSAAASARRRERARCAAIFASPSAANNIPLAASLAFETTMTRSEAIAVMKGQAGRAETSARSHRESRNTDLGGGYDPSTTSPAAKANAVWDKAWSAVGIKKTGR